MDTLHVVGLLCQETLSQLFDLPLQDWVVILRVPVDVQVELMEDMAALDPLPCRKPAEARPGALDGHVAADAVARVAFGV